MSGLLFVSCDELRQLFNECRNDINKRILILDVRSPTEYKRSHLCLDLRNNIDAIRRKMRVINIDPDMVKICTTKQIIPLLEQDDLNVFNKRKDATDVIIIDEDSEELGPTSKPIRLINALTRFDNTENKIVVPIKILKGGFTEWCYKYLHFTTDPTYRNFLPRSQSSPNVAKEIAIQLPKLDINQVHPEEDVSKESVKPQIPITKPVPSLPMTPLAIPVAKPVPKSVVATIVQPLKTPAVVHNDKPRFDRNMKPNFELVKSRVNFGKCPEASGRVITGLQNLGNTCFMNSILQCLAYAPMITEYFCSDLYYTDVNSTAKYGSGGELAIQFGALIARLNFHTNRYLEPISFRESVMKHIGFAGSEQQDSHEFLMMLFDKLHHDLNLQEKMKLFDSGEENGTTDTNDSSNEDIRATGIKFWRKHLKSNKSIISDTFEGIFLSTLICTICDSRSNTFEVFNCLSLPIPSDSRCHVTDCLSHFSKPEMIEAAWECPKCKAKREAIKEIVICKLPKILIIHLKR